MEEQTRPAAQAQQVRLSSCELAYALARGQSEEDALATTNLHFGAAPDVARVMLAAGSSGLLAHGLSRQDAAGAIHLSPLLDELVTRVTGATHLVQCHRIFAAGAETLAFHCGPRGLAGHTQPLTDVHALEPLTPEGALARAADFFAVPEAPPAGLRPLLLPHALVAAVRDSRDRDAITRQLAGAAVPPDHAATLAEDLAGARFRGSVVRLAAQPDGGTRAEQRLFVLVGPARVWLLTVVEDERADATRFLPAGRAALRDLLGPVLLEAPASAD